MTVLTKDQLFEKGRIHVEPVEAPERGGKVYIRGLSPDEVEHINNLNKDKETGNEDFTLFPARIFAASVVDPETRENLFTLSDEDVARVNTLPFTLLQRVTVASTELSGISPGAVEAMRKNSLTDPRNDSSTD